MSTDTLMADVTMDLKPIKSTALAVVTDVDEGPWKGKTVPRIRTQAEYELACRLLVRIEKEIAKPAEAVRKKLNASLAATKTLHDNLIHDTITVGEAYVPDVAQAIRAAICEYDSREYNKRAREAQRELNRLQEKAEKAEANGLDAPVLPFVPGLASPKRTTKVDGGMVIVGAKLKATVLDATQLPDEYLMTVPNMKAIEAALEAGREVPGVQAVLELRTTVR